MKTRTYRKRKVFNDRGITYFLFGLFLFHLSGCTEDDLLKNEATDVKNNPMTRTMAYITICTDAYVEVGGYSVYKGTTCETHVAGSWADIPLSGKQYYPDGFPGKYQVSGGGGGFGQTGVRGFNFVKLGEIYGSGSSLNLMEKADLEKVLEELANQPKEYRLILELFVQNKIKIDFRIDPNIKFPALYDKNTKSIKFRDRSEIRWYNFSEELLHAAQHLIFYGDAMDMGYKNYEFEAKVFYDLAYGLASTGLDEPSFPYVNYLPTCTDDNPYFVSEYETWMKNLLDLRLFPGSEQGRFNELCEEWQGYSGSSLPNFNPALILHFFRKPRPH